jgi:purine nucleoside permease
VFCFKINSMFPAILSPRFCTKFLWLALAVGGGALASSLRADPIPVKVAVVVTFEVGADTGDSPGEFQLWAEREKWPIKITVPGLDHPVLTDGKGTIGVVAGTTDRAQIQIMALVLSGVFDFTKTYWICNGIAGGDPAVASIGSAAWSRYIIDGDVAYEIDSKEADASWPYAIIPIGSTVPNEKPKPEAWDPDKMVYELNPGLVAWAFALTKDTVIPDNPRMAAYRALYVGYPNAQKPPFVLLGDSLGTSRYWHGKTMTQWARDWDKLWTDGKGTFAMADMEDQGYSNAFTRLTKMGKMDFQRVLFLRTASNYCMPAPQMDVNKSMHEDYDGYIPSLEAAYRVGSKVLHELAGNWDKYRDSIPSP